MYGYEDEADQCMSVQTFRRVGSILTYLPIAFIEDDSGSEEDDGPTDIVEADLRAEVDTVVEDEGAAEAAAGAGMPMVYPEREKIWHEPGPSPLAYDLASTSDSEQSAPRPVLERPRKIIKIKRDHRSVDRTCARKLVVHAQACLL